MPLRLRTISNLAEEPLRASVTFLGGDPVKPPTDAVPAPDHGSRVRSPDYERVVSQDWLTDTGVPGFKPPTYPGQRTPNSNI